MTDIELKDMPDHDLLVIAVTTINSMNDKVDGVCVQVASHEKQLIILQTEHNERKNQPTCAAPQDVSSKKEKVIFSSIGSVGGAALALLGQYILKKLGL